MSLGRAGSIAQAAEQLGVSYTTVAGGLFQLDSSLNTKLFDRHPSGIHLTSEGHGMLASAEKIEVKTLALESDLEAKSEQATGEVTLVESHTKFSLRVIGARLLRLYLMATG